MVTGISSLWPPAGPTSVTRTIPAYAYVQYQNDDNIAAFFDAYNAWAQAYVDWFNALNLPIYTQDPVSGALLDWVAQSIYGIRRPILRISVGYPPRGAVNTFLVNSLPVNGGKAGTPDTYSFMTDDFYRRIITWAFYKGDGRIFTPRWLKRRINRFLNGVNGTDVRNDTSFTISVMPTGFQTWTIRLAATAQSRIFQSAVQAGILELPFQITWTVELT